MRESPHIQPILREGRQEGLKDAVNALTIILIELRQRKFGGPSPNILKQLDQINETAPLQSRLKRILDVESWGELLN